MQSTCHQVARWSPQGIVPYLGLTIGLLLADLALSSDKVSLGEQKPMLLSPGRTPAQLSSFKGNDRNIWEKRLTTT